MKAFEFRLQRIADFRRQQSDVAKSRLQMLLGEMQRLEEERRSLEEQRHESRSSVTGRNDAKGEDFFALASFQEYLGRRMKELSQKESDLAAKIEKQRDAVVEAERKVKLLDRLKERKFQEWRAASDRELDDLAADSHMARLAAQRVGAQHRRLVPLCEVQNQAWAADFRAANGTQSR
jgi:flagellar protein FliJ